MRKTSTEAISLIGAAAAVVLFFLACTVNIRTGYASDAGTYVLPTALGAALVLLPLICAAAFVGFLLLSRHAEGRGVRTATLAMIAVLALYSLAVGLGWFLISRG